MIEVFIIIILKTAHIFSKLALVPKFRSDVPKTLYARAHTYKYLFIYILNNWSPISEQSEHKPSNPVISSFFTVPMSVPSPVPMSSEQDLQCFSSF